MAVQITKPVDQDQAEKVEIFELDGKKFFIEKKTRLNVSLKYMRLAKTDSMGAGQYLIETLIGEEAWKALEECEYLTTDNLNDVISAAAVVAFGDTEDESGKA